MQLTLYGTMLMVDDQYDRLNLEAIIGPLKDKGIPIDPLVRGTLAYKLGDNFSVLRAGEWLNRPEVREHYGLPKFNVKTLYRAVETLGRNRETIVRELQDRVLKLLGLETTDILMDWTSIVYYGDMTSLARYGYSRDHRPDRKQVTLGVAQLAPPINVPIGMTVEAGNMNDQEHFRRPYDQVRRVLNESSLIVFDKGANDRKNLDSIVLDRNDYLTSKKLNIADDKVFQHFDESTWERVDAVYGILFIGFLAQLMISLTRYFVAPARAMSTKFISNSLQKVTVTVVRMGNGLKKRFYSNFDEINRAVLAGFLAET